MVAGVLTAVAFGVRWLHLTSTDIAGDEPFSIFISQLNLGAMIRFLSTGNNPPLFEMVLHYWILWFGTSEVSLRLLPAIFGSLTVIPVFLAGKRFFNSGVAIIASILFVFSIYHIRFAHEIRVYSLFSLATAWTMYFFLSAIRNPRAWGNWIAVALCNVILLYSHFTSFYILLVEVGCGFLFVERKNWKFPIGALVASVVFYTPYLYTFILRFGDVSNNGTWVSPPGLGEVYGSVNLMLNQRLTTLAILVSIILGIGLTGKWNIKDWILKIRNKAALTVLIWFVLPYSLMYLISVTFIPMFIDRYILYTSIPLFLTIGWITTLVWEETKWPWLGVLIIAIGSIATTNLNPPNNREIKKTVAFIDQRHNENSQVYICPDHFSLAYAFHHDRSLFNQVNPSSDEPIKEINDILMKNGIFPVSGVDELDLDNNGQVIFLDADSKFVLPDNKILETLHSQLHLVDSAHFHQIFDVYVFEPNR